MDGSEIKPNISDFSTVDTSIQKIKEDFNLKDKSSAFYYYVLDLLLNLQEDEIKESITDTCFLAKEGKCAGHDRGIDAVYVEQTETKNKIHFFNFKYVETFERTKSNFPANEIDKLLVFLNALWTQDKDYIKNINPTLSSKMEEIWEIFKTENPSFVMHICTNQYYPFEAKEKERFEREVNKYKDVEIKYHLMPELVNLLTKKGKIIVNAKIQAIDKQYFDRSDGDVKALIVNIDVVDLLRICIDKEEYREAPFLEDYKILKKQEILDDAFEDNVRIYLKQRSKINRNIKNTALSDENHRVFYYNNGITITCEHFEFPGGNKRSPIIELKGLQVVNGGQTIHALFEAFQEDPSKFEDMTILCRIYETKNKALSTNIAEYTNSQNPVKTRDIRSIDYIQIKLEKEFLAMGYFYERKKNLYSGKPLNKRLDAEKVGQVLMAFYNKMPGEAKDKKRLIFAEKYDDVFNDSLTAKMILLPINLFKRIEDEKSDIRSAILKEELSIKLFKENGPLLYSSYWVLYVLHELAVYKKIEVVLDNLDKISKLYGVAAQIVKDVWKEELRSEKGRGKAFAFESFFKKSKPMKYLDKFFEMDKIKEYLKEEKIVNDSK